MGKLNGKQHTAKIGVIGGSGLYEMPGFENVKDVEISTPFGACSDKLVVGELKGVPTAFLPRHGKGHRLTPTEINHRANLWALKSLGVEQVLSFAAVGSLREELPPRTFVFPEQLVDETKRRVSTFFGEGVVAHVAFARPFCRGVSDILFAGAQRLKIPSKRGGVYCCMEGPQFSTKAESEMHRSLGYDLIGMTVVPESKLAREAELCFGAVSMVTDYDCWKDEDEVSTSKVVEHLMANVENAKRLVAETVVAVAARPRSCECATALQGAVFTHPAAIPKAAYERLELLIGRYVAAPKK